MDTINTYTESNITRILGSFVDGEAIHGVDRKGWEVSGVAADPNGRSARIDEMTRVATALPAIHNSAIVLPNMAGHAHFRAWERGDIIKLEGAYWRIASVKVGGSRVYKLAESSREKYASRKVRVALGGDEALALLQVGSVVEHDEGRMIVKKVESHRFSGAMGRGVAYVGVGPMATDEQAGRAASRYAKKMAKIAAENANFPNE